MMKNTNIRLFVKKTLGCECPEEVFEYIDCQNEIKINNMVSLKNKINIGNRLLIYVLDTDDPNFLKGNLSKLILIGKRERDLSGFNRLRVVVVTDKVNEIKNIAETIFRTLKGRDEKVHLHIVQRKEYQRLLI
jgi:hypothetical protein